MVTLRGISIADFDEVIVAENYALIGFNKVGRGCTCGKCGKSVSEKGETLNKGDERVFVVTSGDKVSYHKSCYLNMCDFVADTNTIATNYESKLSKDFDVVIKANKYLAGYFMPKGFIPCKNNAQTRKYTFDMEHNRSRFGQMFKKLLADGFKPIVNGVEVSSFEQLDEVTR